MTLTSDRTADPAPQVTRQQVGRQAREVPLLTRIVRARAFSVVAATIVLALAIAVFNPRFLQVGQLLDILQSSTYIALLAGGAAYLLAMREIDLSSGSMFALTLIAVALLIQSGVDPWIAAVLGVVLGAVLGAVNAAAVNLLGIPTIVVTLATMSVFRGLGVGITGGTQVTGLPVDHAFFTVIGGKIAGIPVSIGVVAVVLVIMAVALHHTPFGYRILAVGSNPDAAEFSGISVRRVRTAGLVIMGALAGLAGVLGLAYFTSGDPNIGTGFELQAIAAAIIGGTALRGGSATILGAAVGVVLLNVVSAGLTYFGIPANWSAFATGSAILLAVGLDSLARRRRAARPKALTAAP